MKTYKRRDCFVGRQSGLLAMTVIFFALGNPLYAALPHNIPDFTLDTSRANIRSAGSGNWSSPSTWIGGVVPGANTVVHIDMGHTVTIDNTSAVAYTIGVHGTLRFNPAVNTSLKVTNLMVMPGDAMGMGSGYLEVGTAANPIASNVTAEIVISNTPIGNSLSDPEGFGTGILGMGKTTMHGTISTPTFVRMAAEPKAGNSTLTLEQAVSGWRAGDKLILPDTRHMRFDEVTNWMNNANQWEELTVQSVSADGRTVTLTAPLAFNHDGARDGNNVLNFLPHVGNLTRNLIIRSESPAGTRGHCLFVHMADADIRYVSFKEMGRTTVDDFSASNLIGRYSLHAHHLMGPMTVPANGYMFTFLGNSVDGGPSVGRRKWGVTIHNSHYGLVQDNVVYNWAGSGIAFEDGSESYNVVDHNFVVRVVAFGAARDDLFGREGVGFWSKGFHNYFRNNVAANMQNNVTETAYGYAFLARLLGNVRIPTAKGQDTALYVTRDGNNLPILQFENNEVYGATAQGLTFWWLSSADGQPKINTTETVIKNFKAWHIYNKAVYVYPAADVTFDGLVIRGKDPANSACCNVGVFHADYSQKDVNFTNADIQGIGNGIKTSEFQFGTIYIDNSNFRTAGSAIDVPISGSVNGGGLPGKTVVVRNSRFAAWSGGLSSINPGGAGTAGGNSAGSAHEIKVYRYQGNVNDNFQVYWTNTAIGPRPPGGCVSANHPETSSLTCVIPAEVGVDITPPSVSITAPANNAAVSGTTNLSATASDNAAVAGVQFKLDGANTGLEDTVAPYGIPLDTIGLLNGSHTISAVARDTSGNSATAAPINIIVNNVDTTPPIITGVNATAVTGAGATINFQTNEPSMHQADYGPTTAYGASTPMDMMMMTSHSDVLTALLPNTLYHYRVHATDGSNNEAISADFTFTTANLAVNQPPTAGAGSNQTITLPALASLSGTAADDGLPAGSVLNLTWSQVSGPGIVSFSNAKILNPTASFSTEGAYVLRLTASDSLLSVTSDVTITVNAAPVNQIPQANAGGDQTITLPAQATISGTAVDDGLPNPPVALTYAWSMVSGPGTVTFGNAAIRSTTASFSSAGSYVIRFTANDSLLAGSDDITITVIAVNQAPQVNAGIDQSVTLPALGVLKGTAGDDGLPNPPASLTYTWSMVSGPGIVGFSASGSLNTSASFSAAGSYVLRLTAGDGALSASDDIAVTVNPVSVINQAPIVNAGSDITLTLPQQASLLSIVSDDGLPAGSVLSLTWSKVSGPGTVTFTNANAQNTTATFSAAGTYVLRMTANDSLLQGSDDVTVTVNPVPAVNQPPTASAGPSQTITLPAQASLSGTAADDGLPTGSVLNLTWSKVSGPGTVSFSNTKILNPTASFSTVGTYVLRLTASDSLLSMTSDITITVNAAAVNQIPQVNAGIDQTITLPTQASLSGIGTDDGLPNPPGALTYTWSKVSGPGTVTFGNSASQNTMAGFSSPGSYVLRLTANDSLLSGSDDIVITVNTAADTTAPVISGIAASGITSSGVTISWVTNEGATHRLDYGPTASYGNVISDSMLMTTHSQTLTGLLPNTVYHYRIQAADAGNNTAASNDLTFTTMAGGSVPPPPAVFTNFREMLPPDDPSQVILAIKSNDPAVLSQVSANQLQVTVALPSGNRTMTLSQVIGDPNYFYIMVSSSSLSAADRALAQGSNITLNIAGSTITGKVEPDVVSSVFGGKVVSGQVTVLIKAGGMKGEGQLMIMELMEDETRRKALAKANLIRIGKEMDFMLSSGSLSAATLSIPMDMGLVPSGRSLSYAKMAYYNPATNTWEVQNNANIRGELIESNVGHFSIYAPVMQMPVSSGEFKEGYIYPNPAVSGETPVIRVKIGLVEEVKIDIYDMSGRRVHSASFPGEGPAIGTDGEYYYVYAITEKLAGGTYIAAIQGKTSSATAKGKVKFTVVK